MPKRKPLLPFPLPGLARAVPTSHLRLVGAHATAAGDGPDSDPPPAPPAAVPVRLPAAPAPTRALLEQLELEAA